MRHFVEKNYHYYFFIALFVIQIFIFNDYGFSWDEELQRLHGLVSYNYILEKINFNLQSTTLNVPKLENYIDNEYGVFFELLLVFIEKIFNFTDNKSIYSTRHYINSLLFFITCIYFYLTLRNFFSKKFSILGVIIFLLHPRIFAQSFYNSKDIVFMCFFCISNYYFINFFLKQNITNIILLSLFTSLTIGTRVMGIILPILFIFFFLMHNLEKEKLKKLYLLIPYLFFCSIFTIIFWPFLWEDPSRIIDSFTSMSNYDYRGEVFFNGKYFVAKYIPWYYLPITILITTPISYIVIFFVGSFFILKKSYINLINLDIRGGNIWKNNLDLFTIYSTVIVYFTIIVIIELNSTLYNGWRQVFFIYPSIIFILIYGLNNLFSYK